MADRLEGKTAFITGAASGIGAETARLFAREGATVVVADVNEPGAKRIAEEIQRDGGRAEIEVVDVSDSLAFESALNEVARRYGRLDILVNCAFQMVASPLDSLSPDDWERSMAVTLHGTFFGVRAALPIMKAQGGGAIVNFSSLCGQRGQASMGGYGAAKAAVENVTRTAAIEAAAHGIRVNAVAPGAVATPGTLEVYPEGSPQRHAIEKTMPTGRLMQPRQIAQAVLFLASDDASGVNGQVLNVDSGQSSGLGAPELDEGWER